MILLNVAAELRGVLSEGRIDEITSECIETITTVIVDREGGVMYEFSNPDGSRPAGPDGRHVNPGHAIEMSWFILELVRGRVAAGRPGADDDELVALALKVLRKNLEIGWDRDHGGIYYFLDIEAKPHYSLEWNMKLWWPHNEAIYATLLAWRLTGDARYADWHERLHDWSYARFPDKENGEWFGYLHRDGTLSSTLKGNMWKGPFHLPRMQLNCWKLLEETSSAGVAEK